MPTKLQNAIKKSESQTCEFKLSFGEETLETIGAFANAEGGSIFIGVKDDGTINGITSGKKTLEDWANNIQSTTDPRLQPTIKFISAGEKKVGVIDVSASSGLPVSVKGRFFKRVGRTNQRMSHEEIMQRLQSSTGKTWDATVEPTASLDDLDLAQVRDFLDTLRQERRRSVPDRISEKVALEKLDLTRNGVPTRAALLLFAKNPLRYFPTAYIKLGRFRSPILIIDDKRVGGTILQQIEECMTWFRDRFTTEFVITGKPRRDVIWEYPLDAVREAVINAICHRDYRANSNIQVRLYDDRLEIWNPGGLSPSLTTEDLLREHDSIPRNPLLAECLFYAGIIENWGTGTTRMAAELSKSGLSLPEFVTTHNNRFRVVLRQTQAAEPQLRMLDLNDRQIRLVTLLKVGQEQINNEQYQEQFSTIKRTATRELKALVDKGVLTKHGTTGKGVYYTLASRNPASPHKIKGDKRGHKSGKGAERGQ